MRAVAAKAVANLAALVVAVVVSVAQANEVTRDTKRQLAAVNAALRVTKLSASLDPTVVRTVVIQQPGQSSEPVSRSD